MTKQTKRNIRHLLTTIGIILFVNGVHMHNWYMQMSGLLLFDVFGWWIMNELADKKV